MVAIFTVPDLGPSATRPAPRQLVCSPMFTKPLPQACRRSLSYLSHQARQHGHSGLRENLALDQASGDQIE
jgi:hypothetical protein